VHCTHRYTHIDEKPRRHSAQQKIYEYFMMLRSSKCDCCLPLWCSEQKTTLKGCPGQINAKERKRKKSLKQADRRRNKHWMDTERETEASVVGVNAWCERWACHQHLPARWIREEVLLQHFPLCQNTISHWPLGWFARSLLIDNHVEEKPSEAYSQALTFPGWSND